jgi:hypothetical protein
MDRRTFMRALPTVTSALPHARGITAPVSRRRPRLHRRPAPPEYSTDMDRAFGVVAGLRQRAIRDAAGLRWEVLGSTG